MSSSQIMDPPHANRVIQYLKKADSSIVIDSIKDEFVKSFLVRWSQKHLARALQIPLANFEQIIGAVLEDLKHEILHPVKMKEIRERLGKRGLLPNQDFEIEILTPCRKRLKDASLRTRDIERCVHTPDAFEHAFPRHRDSSISLFVKHQKKAREFGAHWLLVVGTRHGAKLSIDDAFRVFPDESTISFPSTPLKMLECFVEQFGLEFEIENKKYKFLFLETVPGSAANWTAPGAPNFGTFHLHRSDGKIEFAVAYVIDRDRYLASLKA